MAQQILNSFTSFAFTSEELFSARIFSTEQKQYLQSKLSQIAEQYLGLEIPTEHPNPLLEYAVQNAYFKAQIEILQELLTESNDTEKERNRIAQLQAKSQE